MEMSYLIEITRLQTGGTCVIEHRHEIRQVSGSLYRTSVSDFVECRSLYLVSVLYLDRYINTRQLLPLALGTRATSVISRGLEKVIVTDMKLRRCHS